MVRPDVETFAAMLESLCGPDDRFASHEDALELAGELLWRSERGDPMADHLIECTVRYCDGKRGAE